MSKTSKGDLHFTVLLHLQIMQPSQYSLGKEKLMFYTKTLWAKQHSTQLYGQRRS
jgi:hypothetical protein